MIDVIYFVRYAVSSGISMLMGILTIIAANKPLLNAKDFVIKNRRLFTIVWGFCINSHPFMLLYCSLALPRRNAQARVCPAIATIYRNSFGCKYHLHKG